MEILYFVCFFGRLVGLVWFGLFWFRYHTAILSIPAQWKTSACVSSVILDNCKY